MSRHILKVLIFLLATTTTLLIINLIDGEVEPGFAYDKPGRRIPSFMETFDNDLNMDGDVICVDCPKYFSEMSDHSLRIDSIGNPHIAFGGDHLYYSWHDGIHWYTELIDASPGVGLFASLDLDENDLPHISYYDSINKALKYAHYNGYDWVTEFIDQPPSEYRFENYSLAEESVIQAVDPEEQLGYGLYTSIKLDNSGEIHIAYYDSINGDLKYSHSSDGTWITENIDVSGNVGKYTSLVIDNLNHPHVSYHDDNNAILKYATWDGYTWKRYIVDATAGSGLYTSIGLDLNSRPHISYFHIGVGHLKCVRWDGSIWITDVIDPDTDTGKYSSLNFDSAGRPHISYYDGAEGNLKFASWTGSYWKIQTVDIAGTTGFFSSLAIDGDDDPYISYYDASQGLIRFASYSDSTWSLENVTGAESSDVGLYTSMELDNNDYPHIAYFDDTHKDLKYAFWTGSQWLTQLVDFNGDVGFRPSLALDANGYPRITYYDISNQMLKYAQWNGTNWLIGILDTNKETGFYSSIAIDNLNRTHVAYTDDRNNDLKYVYSTGIGWAYLTIPETSANVGAFPSLAIDSSNFPHITYYDATLKMLKYAYFSGGSWHFMHADASDEVGQYTSLKLDDSDRPYVAYFSDYDDTLKFAYREDGIWVQDIVDDTANVGYYASLALDATNLPHIAYYNFSNGDLRYASKSGDSWLITTVDSIGDVGRYPSIAIKSDGSRVISYYDATLNDLKYANVEHNYNIDLSIDPPIQVLNGQAPFLPNHLSLGISVKNNSLNSVLNIEVSLYDGNPDTNGTYIGNATINKLDPEESQVAFVEWDFINNIDEHTLYMRASLTSPYFDPEPANNTISTPFSVYYVDFQHGRDAYSFGNYEMGPVTVGDIMQSLIFFDIPEIYFHPLLPFIGSLVEENGYCYGMANSSLVYSEFPNLKPVPTKSTYEHTLEEAEDKVRTYQWYVLGPGLRIIMGLTSSDPDVQYQQTEDSVRWGVPVIHGLMNKTDILPEEGSHAVVAYKVVDLGTEKRVFYYDNNYPLKDFQEGDIETYGVFDNSGFSDPFYPYNYNNAFVFYRQFSDTDTVRILWDFIRWLFGFQWLDQMLSVTTEGPVNLLAIDSLGRQSGYISGQKINEISGAEVTSIEGAQSLMLPLSETYQFLIVEADSLQSLLSIEEESNFSFSIFDPLSNTQARVVDFIDVTLPTDGVAETTYMHGQQIVEMSLPKGVTVPADVDTIINSPSIQYLPIVKK